MKSASFRENNFDILRICLALFVIIGHSYELTGLRTPDALNRATNGVGTFSYLGVAGFFVISGCLVHQSFLRSSSYKEFLFKRSLRIFPGLLVNLVFIAFVAAPFITRIPGYLYHSREPYQFVLSNMLLVKPVYNLGDVFSKNPYANILNGSLWTLAYEALFYVLFIFLFLLRKHQRIIMNLIPLFVAATILLTLMLPQHYIPLTTIDTRYIFQLSTWFMIGMWLSHTGNKPLLNKIMLAAGSLVLVLTFAGILPAFMLFIGWPVVIIRLGSLRTPVLSKVHILGDPSYGIYIYGFFIQQLLVSLGYTGLVLHMCLAIIISVIVGYASWHLVEKRALKLKKYTQKSPELKAELRAITT